MTAHYAGQEILAYHYHNPAVSAEEVPKPYFHPLRTLGGSVVTLCRPNDHPWHKGVGMTLTKVGDANFWGGVTYRHGAGYTWIPNYGRQRHTRWVSRQQTDTGAQLSQEIAWEDFEGARLLSENRSLRISVVPAAGYWTLDLTMEIANAAGRPLRLGTYESSEQLTGSFYTGLFWRLPREFLDHINTLHYNAVGAVFCEGCPPNDPAMHGTAARWVALHGSVDTVVKPLTVAMVDRSSPAMSQPRVFIRRHTVGVALPFQGPEDRILPPDGVLRLAYRLLIADGHWPEQQLIDYCQAAATDGG
jgi:hypothetical protein